MLATGGGALHGGRDAATTSAAPGISVWLKAELPVLLRRVLKRNTRPLLEKDPEGAMRQLMETRYPIYATADITVESRDLPHDAIVGEIIDALAKRPLLASQRSALRARWTKRHERRPLADRLPAATITVALGSRSYDVLVGPGLMARAADLIEARLGKAKCGIVTDDNVAARHLAPLEASLKAGGRHAGTTVLPPGEATKSFAALARLCERLLEMGLERRDS